MPTYITVNGVRYEISDHCLKRMARRGIRKQHIQSCLNHHEVDCIFKCGYSLYIEDYPKGKRLQVVVDPKNNKIVSVIWLTQ
jgi:hypothetical protein